MNAPKKVFILLTLVSLLFLSGCGDLLQKEVVKRPLDSTQFKADCELDIDAFSRIMEEDISGSINCLGENLKLFIKVVESDRKGFLSREKLEVYLRNNRSDVKPDVIRALKAIFDINYLIFGEDPNYISEETLNKIINFALLFNSESAVNFNPIFNNENVSTYTEHKFYRERINSAAKVIVAGLKGIYNPNRGGQIHKVNIMRLLESFSTGANVDFLEKVKKVIFTKRVLVGGESEVLTNVELERLFNKFDSLVVLALDGMRYNKIKFENNQQALLDFLKTDIDLVESVIFNPSMGNRNTEHLFRMDEAFEAIKLFVKAEKFDTEKFKDLIFEGKIILMGGSKENVSGANLKRLFRNLDKVASTGADFHRFYGALKNVLNDSKEITDNPRYAQQNPNVNFVNFNDLRIQFPGKEKQVQDFSRIIVKYRFFKGQEKSAFYTKGFERNANGIFQIYLFEYLIELVFEKYGSPAPGVLGGSSMDKDQVISLMLKFEESLIDMGIILPGKTANTADTLTLLGSLFQYQSDENKLFDVNEATEFAVSLMTAIDVSDKLMVSYKNKCRVDRYDRVEAGCFREHFFSQVCKSYRRYYPRLFEYLGLNPNDSCDALPVNEVTTDYLEMSIKAARNCHYFDDDGSEIPFSKGDAMALFVAMMHIETTILRWDKNHNNIMDENEVMNAYDIYSPALDGFLTEMTKPFKRQIFQYLVKYESIPDQTQFRSIWKFLKFLLRFNKKAPATRKTIAAILYTISQQSQKLNPTNFKCIWLRDPTPENIRRQMSSSPLPSVSMSLESKPMPTIYNRADNGLLMSIESQNDDDISAELRSSYPEIFDR